MGNTIALPHRDSDGGTGKVVLADGTIHEYDKPLTVAELMLEYPQQLVIEFCATNTNGPGSGNVYNRPAPLPADKRLEMNKVYVMIPVRRGKPAGALISSEEARRILLRANSFLKSKSLVSSSSLGGGGSFLPFFGRMCAAGIGGKRYEDHRVEETLLSRNKLQPQLKGEEEVQEEETRTADCFSEILMEERPEFLSLSRQISGKGWKPSLDTITEKTVHTKVRHWLF